MRTGISPQLSRLHWHLELHRLLATCAEKLWQFTLGNIHKFLRVPQNSCPEGNLVSGPLELCQEKATDPSDAASARERAHAVKEGDVLAQAVRVGDANVLGDRLSGMEGEDRIEFEEFMKGRSVFKAEHYKSIETT